MERVHLDDQPRMHEFSAKYAASLLLLLLPPLILWHPGSRGKESLPRSSSDGRHTTVSNGGALLLSPSSEDRTENLSASWDLFRSAFLLELAQVVLF